MRSPLAAACIMSFAVWGGVPAGPAAAQQARQVGPVLYHTPIRHYAGSCEPSGAVAVPEGNIADGRVIVADDNDNVLRAYAAGGGGAARDLDLNAALGVPKDDVGKNKSKGDLEGAAWLGGRIYWIGSHSRNSDGEVRQFRQGLIATQARADGSPGVEVVGTPANLLKALASHAQVLERAVGPSGTDKSLAPEKGRAGEGGLNIEGLAAGRDGRSLLIGLRSPLSQDGRAILVPLANPADAVARKAPQLGELVLLDLGGRGVRSLEWLPSRGFYVIAAGPVGSTGKFGLYTWSGQAEDKPVALAGADAFLQGLGDSEGPFSPEAMVADKDGRHLLLLSDDGDRETAGGKACKELGEGNPGRRFRGVLVSLD